MTPVPFELSTARPPLPPLDGRPLVVHVVVNVEHWPLDRAMPRKILPSPHGLEAVPDVPNFSWVEYGLRCGLPRILAVLGDAGVPASAALNASVIDAYPPVADAIRGAGWEPIGHGVDQRTLQTADDESAVVEDAAARIERYFGSRPRGWLGPGLQETFRTPEVLKRAGFDYVCDWVVDDLPAWLETPAGALVAVPYTLELNDSVLHAVEHQPSDALYVRLVDTLATLDRELPSASRVLTLALHPHLIGAPHRVCHLRSAIELLRTRDDAVFVTGSRIADWFAGAPRPSEA
jgi:peptidoglycan/xylan/chitin deacetylase (PgdA/CDA1 family)